MKFTFHPFVLVCVLVFFFVLFPLAITSHQMGSILFLAVRSNRLILVMHYPPIHSVLRPFLFDEYQASNYQTLHLMGNVTEICYFLDFCFLLLLSLILVNSDCSYMIFHLICSSFSIFCLVIFCKSKF